VNAAHTLAMARGTICFLRDGSHHVRTDVYCDMRSVQLLFEGHNAGLATTEALSTAVTALLP
jgi:hypothetical protein